MPLYGKSVIDSLTPKATGLKAKQIGESWSEKIRTQSIFSARTTEESYLDELKRRLKSVAGNEETPQVAQRKLQATLAKIGYTPNEGFPNAKGVAVGTEGSITDLSSEVRLRLIMKTNCQQARSMGQLSASQSPIFRLTNPAWRLTRTGWRREPRKDWRQRWKAAGDSVGWEGAIPSDFVALKSSPIWDALGAGAGGFKDTLHEAYPPFAYGSGMAWVHVSRKEAIALGLDVSDGAPTREEINDYVEKRDSGELDPRDLPSKMPEKYADTPRKPQEPQVEVEEQLTTESFTFNRSALDSAMREIDIARGTLVEARRRLDTAKARLATATGTLHDSHVSADSVVRIAERKVADIELAISSSDYGINSLSLHASMLSLPTNESEQEQYNQNCSTIYSAATLYVTSLNALDIHGIPTELETAARIAKKIRSDV